MTESTSDNLQYVSSLVINLIALHQNYSLLKWHIQSIPENQIGTIKNW